MYLRADGVYFDIRAGNRRCMLVVIDYDMQGNGHFLALEDGLRASAANWKAALSRLRDHGVNPARDLPGGG